MSAQIVVPDYIGALVVFLRQQTVLTDQLPASSITGKMPAFTDSSGRTPAVSWVTVVKAPGTTHPYVPIIRPRIDIRCYGSSGLNAMTIWRALHSALEPPQIKQGGFHITDHGINCRYLDIALENTPMDMNDDGWPMVFCTYRATVMEVMYPLPEE